MNPEMPSNSGNTTSSDREQTLVSLCLIVRNEAANLPTCLRSVRDLVDEIVIVDTGSRDQTKEVATQLGAHVFEFAWADDFAAARNESLCHAKGRWIFWLDADERLDEENRGRLRMLFAGLGDDNVAYTMQQRSELEPSTYSTATVDQVRLFRNHPEIRWQYRVHEQILPAVRRASGELRRTDIVIEHTGFQDPAVQGPKVERNLRLLLLENAERPDDPFVLFNIASVYLGRNQVAEAIPLLQRSLQLSQPGDTIVRKLYALLARAHHQLGQTAEALAACQTGQAQFPGDPELLFWEGMLLRGQGRLAEAERCLQRVLETGPGATFTGVDAGMQGYKARHCLAEIYRDQGRWADAEAQWRQVVEERPHFAPAWLGLAGLFQAQSRWVQLQPVARRLLDDPPAALEAAGFLARAQLSQGQFAAARQTLEGIIARAPQALTPRILLTHVLLQEGRDLAGAEKALREVLKLDPRQAESWHNLVTLLRRQRRTAEAFAACQAGRLYCGDHADLHLLEGLVLEERGDLRGAESCLLSWLERHGTQRDSKDPSQASLATARQTLANIYRRQKRDNEAEAQWRLLLDMQPDGVPALLELGDLLLAQGRWDEVERIAERLVRMPPYRAEAELLRARALLGRSDFAAARRILETLIAEDPRAVRPRVALSYTYLQEGHDWAAAERALRDVLALDPNHAETRHNLATLLRQQGGGV
jgi:tetratricopeptide (TPR) repeat protein